MRVISLINSTMISETSSIFALYYAKSYNLKLTLLHIRSGHNTDMVEKVFRDVNQVALSLEVAVDLLYLDSLEELRKLVYNENIDMLFCSTKHQHSLLEPSFAKRLIRMEFKVDLAIVKVAKQGVSQSVEKIIMPIRGYHLSVKKFTFFSTMVNAYDADAEIFSIDPLKKGKAAVLDAKMIKQKLKEVIFNLRHYFRLATIMKMKFSIKHHYALVESDDVRSHIVKNRFDLAIVGGHHKQSLFQKHPIDVLFEKPLINTIYFIPSKDNT